MDVPLFLFFRSAASGTFQQQVLQPGRIQLRTIIKVEIRWVEPTRDASHSAVFSKVNAILILEFANGTIAMAEESWTKLGGMDDRAEVHGSHGVAYADLLHGNAIETYSTAGYGYAVEKAGSTKGWSFTIYEESWNYGFPQEMAHFIDCVQNDKPPLVTGEDGRAVLEVIFAAYESARTGCKAALPFRTTAAKPHDLWKPA